MLPFKHELGKEAKDLVTGFSGLIIYRCEYMTGCSQYGLQPKVDEKGVVPECKQFDENRVVIIGEGVKLPEEKVVELKKPETKRTGGPQPVMQQTKSLA